MQQNLVFCTVFLWVKGTHPMARREYCLDGPQAQTGETPPDLLPKEARGNTLTCFFLCRIVDDYIAIFFGITVLRTGKILIVVLIVVHMFTCAYWYIKVTFTTPSEITDFLSARQIDETVPD